MTQNFLDLARQGNNRWWRYLVSIVLILFLWLIVGGLISGIWAVVEVWSKLPPGLSPEAFQKQLEQQATAFLTTPSIISYVITNIPFIFLGLGLWIAMKGFHQRPFLSLIGGDRTLHWRSFWTSFGLWTLLSFALVPFDYFLHPQNYVWSFNPGQWFLLLPVALILTPLQTSMEELLFRGYFLQGLGLFTRQRMVLLVISGLLFMVPHLVNPEMQRGSVMALYYFAFGVFLTALTLKSDRLELALGVHAANNLQVLFFNSADSALPAPSMVQIKEPGDLNLSIGLFLVQCAVFYFWIFRRQSR
jgi:uncharacterized protein